MHLKPSNIDLDAFLSVLELLGEPEIRERYDAGQYERKCYRVLVAGGWRGRHAGWVAGRPETHPPRRAA